MRHSEKSYLFARAAPPHEYGPWQISIVAKLLKGAIVVTFYERADGEGTSVGTKKILLSVLAILPYRYQL